MGKQKRDPVDFETWDAWEVARRRDGKMPTIAKPVPYAVAGILLALLIAWLLADRIGGTLDDGVLSEGTATLSGSCRTGLEGLQRCPATTASGNDVEVWSTVPLSGTVEVQVRERFTPGRNSRYERQVWSAEHHPSARPWLFPTIFGGAVVVSFSLAGVWITYGNRMFVRRSKRRWAEARRAAGRST